jgi:hypothetical protein
MMKISVCIGTTLMSTTMLAAPCLSQASSAGPVRQLPASAVTSPEALGSLAAVRGLSNGSVLVNDQVSRRVLLLDSDLKLVRVVADSTPNTNNAYGGRSGGLFPFRGDTSLFVDPSSLSFLVIDPEGRLVRTMAAPRPNDINFMTGGNMTMPGFDAQGRMLYRGRMPSTQNANKDPVVPDSAPIVRVDLSTRKADTAAYFKIQKTIVSVTKDASGNIMSMNMMINNLLPLVDEWAVMSDGTAAIVRGQDYRVDFLNADGTVTRGAKLPYDWERLPDEKKAEIIDSTRAFREKARAQILATAPVTTRSAAGERVETRMSKTTDGSNVSIAMGPGNGPPPPIMLPEPSDLPDYRPAFGIVGVKADMENRIWVRTTAVLQSGGGAVYDVIDRSGKREDRVQLPVGTTIAGFGKGVVYYGFRDESGIHLKKAPIR